MPSLTEAAAEAVDVILRDGGTLRLRPPSAEDADAVLAFFAGHPPEVAELDLNPILAGPEGCVAVDARRAGARAPTRSSAKGW